MGKCKHILFDEKPCGLEASDDLCVFHRMRRIESSDSGRLKWYLDNRNRDYIDLTGRRFRDITFDGNLLPSEVETRFNNSEFEGCRFTGISFQRSVSFRECIFLGSHFRDVVVRAAAVDFELSTMTGLEVQFDSCDFRCTKGIAFVGAHIECGTTPFRACYFQAPQIQFNDCTLNTDRLYVLIVDKAQRVLDDRYLALAGEQIYFVGLKLNGHFEYANLQMGGEESPMVIFSQVNFRQMKTAVFFEANLKRARFTYSVLHNVEFRNPRFEKSNGRRKIYDEIVRVRDTDDEHIRDVYIQLKRNYEEAHNYADAGDWFYREMECRRRLAGVYRAKHPWLGLPATILYHLYKFVSEYGENYWRPFAALIGVLLLGGLCYFYGGYGVTKDTINYDFVCPPTAESFWGFVDALLYSLGVMSFQVTKTGFQHSTATTAVTLALVLFTLILVPLFLLALRRKFRR